MFHECPANVYGGDQGWNGEDGFRQVWLDIPMTRSLQLKLAGAALAGVLMGLAGFAVAAALPQPARNAHGHTPSTVGVSVPHTSQAAVSTAAGGRSSEAKGPDVTGPSRFGLCTAFASGQGGVNGKKNDAVPFRNLQDAAEAATQSVAEFCAGVAPHAAVAAHDRSGLGQSHRP